MASDLLQATRDALLRLELEFGFWAPKDLDKRDALKRYTHEGLDRIGASPEDVTGALDRLRSRWQSAQEEPKKLDSMYLVGLVRSHMYITKQKQEYETPSRQLTDEEFEQFLDYCYDMYCSGGAKWAIVRAGCPWMAERLDLDWSKHILKATEKVKADRQSEALGYGLILEQAAIAANQNAVESEAKRLAMTEYFKKYDSQRTDAGDHQVSESATPNDGLAEHDGPGQGS